MTAPVLPRVVEDDAQHVPVAGVDGTDAVAQLHPVVATGPEPGAVPDREDHRLAEPGAGDRRPELLPRPLLDAAPMSCSPVAGSCDRSIRHATTQTSPCWSGCGPRTCASSPLSCAPTPRCVRSPDDPASQTCPSFTPTRKPLNAHRVYGRQRYGARAVILTTRSAGLLRTGLGFLAGAVIFVVIDTVLDQVAASNPTGLALLAGVTLDGVPENTALGVPLTTAGSVALLVAVFASNFPEALAGAVSMRDAGHSRLGVVGLWAGATALLAAAVVLGRLAFSGASPEQLALPLAFAGGAVLASVIDTLAPEAFRSGGPLVALASATGFFTAFVLGA